MPSRKNLKLLMFAAEPLGFLPATHVAFGGEMRSSYFQNTTPDEKDISGGVALALDPLGERHLLMTDLAKTSLKEGSLKGIGM